MEGYQNGTEYNGIIKEVTIRWRTSKDDDKEVEMKIGKPLSLIFWLTQKGTYQLGLLIDPKSDSSVSKEDQQNKRVTL
jgi:ribosome biogenesis protein Tsr3